MSSADPADLADDFPSPEPSNNHLPSMDMSSELANQALAQQVEQAAKINTTSGSTNNQASSSHATSHNDQYSRQHLQGALDTGIDPTLDEDPNTITHENTLSSAYRRHPTQSQSHIGTSGLAYKPVESLTNNEQLSILRDAYARNPNPGKKELESLAERTGRPWNKIREYFRQRRNKMRGLDSLESMEEPGRASGWLLLSYRSGPPTSQVSQLHLYNSYKTRFDPYSTHTPLLGGQELVQLACATFPGCEMAKSEDDYILRGIKIKEEFNNQNGQSGSDALDKRVDDLVEPLRGTSWLLSTFQHHPDSDVTQTDLYASYAARFADLPESSGQNTTTQHNQTSEEAELREFEAEMAAPETNGMDENDLHSFSLALGAGSAIQEDQAIAQQPKREERLLNPVELISLTRMTFPEAVPAVDDSGRFVIRGIERRDREPAGKYITKLDEMFPFALAAEPEPSDPDHPFTSLLKRKLATLHPDSSNLQSSKKTKKSDGLPEEERELLEGLKRFKSSPLGKEVRDVCLSQ